MNTLTQHFGIGAVDSIDSLLIRWPSGVVDTICDPDINQTLHIIEGSSQVCPGTYITSFINDLLLYPNPTSGYAVIKGTFSHNVRIEVTDLYGNRLRVTSIIGDNELKLDIADFASGMYFVRIRNNGVERTFKVVKTI